MSLFKRAERKRVWVKLAVTGPSGSGKTLSALHLAMGLAGKDGKIALLDTENGSASLYSDVTAFDAAEIAPPFTIDKYVQVIDEAVAAGYEVLIIDSLSHAWAGDGGLLAQKETLDNRNGGKSNQFGNWQPITKQHEHLKSVILQAPIHIITTIRAKTEYLNEGGKVQKVGMGLVQRNEIEYEFTVVFSLSQSHEAMADKDRTRLFDTGNTAIVGKLQPAHGQAIRQWLSSAPAMDAEPQVEVQPLPPLTPEQELKAAMRAFSERAEDLGYDVRKDENTFHKGRITNLVQPWVTAQNWSEADAWRKATAELQPPPQNPLSLRRTAEDGDSDPIGADGLMEARA